MMRLIFYAFTSVIFVTGSFAQNRYPEFKNEPTTLKVPMNMMGVRVDKAQSGTITYDFNGYVFKEGENNIIQERTTGFDGKTDKATPYETLTELVDVVRQRSWKDLLKLYTEDSRREAERIVPADKRDAYFNGLNANLNVKVVLGMDYKEGYIVLIENTDGAIQPVYFEKRKNKYLLSTLVDSSAMLWNISVFMRFKPSPMVAPQVISKLDSLKSGEEQQITFKVNKPGNRVLLFKNQVNTTVIISIQDNMPGDYNPEAGLVEIRLGNKFLPARKTYEILALESNYPTIKVTEDMPGKSSRITFKVY